MATEGKVRVALVDDTPDIRELLRTILSLESFIEVVGEGADGSEAVTLVEETNPHVLVIDLAMPVMDGLEAITEIRERGGDLAILVLSGFDEARASSGALKAGADAYLAKGTPPRQIIDMIRRLGGLEEEEPQQPSASISVATEEPLGEETLDLLPIVTHELRNQAAVIEGFASTLHQRWDHFQPDEIRSFIASIARNSKQLSSLVLALTDVRQIYDGELQLVTERVNAGAFVKETLADLRSMTRDRVVRFRVEDETEVEIDQVKVRQILTNLLSNATKFSPPDGAVEVSVESHNGSVRIGIADEGPGVPAGSAPQLFKPFVRLDKSVEGTGIGLYLSRAIALAHGGDLHHEPAPTGARFVLTLPHP